MLTIRYHTAFKREFKKMVKRGCDPAKLEEVVSLLTNQIQLPPKYRNHPLNGDYSGFYECHIQPDWLLIYRVNNEVLGLCLAHTGIHSDLFEK